MYGVRSGSDRLSTAIYAKRYQWSNDRLHGRGDTQLCELRTPFARKTLEGFPTGTLYSLSRLQQVTAEVHPRLAAHQVNGAVFGRNVLGVLEDTFLDTR